MGGARTVLRAARWSVVAVPLADVLLVLTGVLDARTGLAVGAALELLLGAVVVAEVVAFGRTYRQARAAGGLRGAAVSAGLAAALPAPVAWFLRSEAGVARALWWAVRRRRDVGAEDAGDVALPYTDRIAVMLWMTVGLGAVESAVAHVLVPWPTLRWVLSGLGLYGLLWVVGLASSLRQHPHLLRGEELLLRFGHFRATRVPLTGLVSARRDVRTGHRHNVEWADGTLSLSVAGETAVELTFSPEVVVEVRGRVEPVTRVRFFADDPRAAVRLLQTRTASPSR